MYIIPYHKEKNRQVIHEFIEQYPFAFLTGCDSENSPVVTQIPVFLEESNNKKFLRGHIMKGTDHHKAFLENKNVLAVFTGKNCYVSGTWYSKPNTASTWNYMSVHIKGSIQFLDDNALEEVLQKTSLYFENMNEESPTVYDNLPVEFKQRVMHMIVAFEIEVEEIDTVFKLSQDRDAESYFNIIEKLKSKDNDARTIASEMEKRAKEQFPDY